MNKQRWKLTIGVLFTAMFGFIGAANALSQLGQDPAADVIVSAGGLEWVWAGPCAPIVPSCGVVQEHSGFGLATDQDWLSSFADLNAIIAAFVPNGVQKCASSYFNTVYDHCDTGDLQIGAIWHLPASFGGAYTNDPNAEAFLVRGAVGVPEPGTLGLLALGLVGVGLRRKRTAIVAQ